MSSLLKKKCKFYNYLIIIIIMSLGWFFYSKKDKPLKYINQFFSTRQSRIILLWSPARLCTYSVFYGFIRKTVETHQNCPVLIWRKNIVIILKFDLVFFFLAGIQPPSSMLSSFIGNGNIKVNMDQLLIDLQSGDANPRACRKDLILDGFMSKWMF